MEKAKVYFTDLRTREYGDGLPKKLQTLIRAAGIGNIDMDGKFVAIKTHFGELGNVAFLRPNFSKAVADVVKELGGKPFLTDCNTMYPGFRKNAIEHLFCAWENGFSPLSTGCPILIADGLKGTDEVAVPVKGGEYVKEAKIGRAVMDADVFISLNHFKGHNFASLGGALKNIGMGCGSRAGKKEMHSSGQAEIFTNDEANELLSRKIAEYAKAVVDGRPCFHITLVMDISPSCDCHCENDTPMLPDIGMFASTDPLALDQACVDACAKAEPLPGSQLWEALHDEHFHETGNLFNNLHPESDWKSCFEQAEKLGIGTREYELITVNTKK